VSKKEEKIKLNTATKNNLRQYTIMLRVYKYGLSWTIYRRLPVMQRYKEESLYTILSKHVYKDISKFKLKTNWSPTQF